MGQIGELPVIVQAHMPASVDVAAGRVPRPLELGLGDWPGGDWCQRAPAFVKFGLHDRPGLFIAGHNTNFGPQASDRQIDNGLFLREVLGEQGPVFWDWDKDRLLAFNCDGTRVAFFGAP